MTLTHGQDKLHCMQWWHRSRARFITKVLSLLITITFVLPYLTWAFEATTFPKPKNVFQLPQQTVEIPDQFALALSSHQGTHGLVIHIQDLHCNYEVQSNIAKLIEHLAQNNQLRLVGIEGASLPVNTTHLSLYPDEHVKQAVGKYYMKQGKISGAEYYAATGKHKVLLNGIEKADLYSSSHELVMSFLKDESQGYVYDLREALGGLKSQLYTPVLQKLDEKKQAYRTGKNSPLAYGGYLCAQAKALNLDLASYPHLMAYVSKQTTVLPQDVNPDWVYQEIDRLDAALRNRLYTTVEQKSLDQFEHRLDILEKLFNISVSQEELAEFRRTPQLFSVASFVHFIQQNSEQNEAGWDAELYALDESLKKVLAFYELADARSQAFVENITAQMKTHQVPIAVLVTGGFHTQEVLKELTAKGMSYVSVRPNITHEDLVNPYFSLVRGRRTPLEKLLAQNQNIFSLATSFAEGMERNAVLTPAQEKAQPLERRLFFDAMRLHLQDVGLLMAFKALKTKFQTRTQALIEGLRTQVQATHAQYPYANRVTLNIDSITALNQGVTATYDGVKTQAVILPSAVVQAQASKGLESLEIEGEELSAVLYDQATYAQNKDRLNIPATSLVGTIAANMGQRLKRVLASVSNPFRELLALSRTGRRAFVSAALSLLLIFTPMSALLLTGCTNPAGPDIEEPMPNTKYFQDAQISVEMKADGHTWVVGFKNESGAMVTREGLAGQTIYSQAGVVVSIGMDNRVQVTRPYQDAQGRNGTDTYTVSPTEHTATDLKVTTDTHGRNYSDFTFGFSNPSTGQVAYTATLVMDNGTLVARFVSATGTVLGQQTVTVTRQANTAQTFAFANPYGSGVSQIQASAPVVYADVQATLENQAGKLEVYQKTGTPTVYIIDYYDAFGQHHFEQALTGSIQTLYISDGGDNVLRLTSGISVSEQNGATEIRTLVSPSGLVSEQTTVGTAKTYKVRFMDTVTGLEKDVATLVDQGGGVWVAQFMNSPAVPLTWLEENTAAVFTVNNTAGNGTVTLSFDTAGNINDVAFAHPFRAVAGFIGSLLSAGMAIGQASAMVTVGALVPVLFWPTMVLGFFFGGYFTVGAVSYFRVARAVREAELLRLISENPEADVKVLSRRAGMEAIAWSNGKMDTLAMSFLEKDSPWAARQVKYHETFKTELGGMLALLPGVRLGLRALGTLGTWANKILRIRLFSILLSFLMFFSVTSALVLTGCSKNDDIVGPGIEEPIPNTKVYSDKKLSIEQKADQKTWVITFTDSTGKNVSVEGKVSAQNDQLLYNENGVQVTLTKNNQVVLSRPATDAQGRKGTETYTVSLTDRTGIDLVDVVDANGQHYFEYGFSFANASTGKIEYTAKLVTSASTITAVFTKADGTELGQQPVTVVVNADLSQTYTFSNPYGNGASKLTVTTPATYTDVKGVAYLLPGTLEVYLKNDGKYIVDYTDSEGKHHFDAVVLGTAQVLLTSSGTQLRITSAGQIEIVRPYQDAQGRKGTDTYSVSLSEHLAVDLKDVTDANAQHFFTYEFTFFSATTGQIEYMAELVQNTDGTASVVFKKLDGTSLGQQSVTVTVNADLTRTYAFANPYGTGATTVTVTAPATYSDVQAVAFLAPGTLEIYQKTNGTYIIDFTDAAGKHHYDAVALSGTQQVLYSQNGIQLSITTDNQVKIVRPYQDAQGRSGTETYSVSLSNHLVTDLTDVTDATGQHAYTYNFSFINATTGRVEYTAVLNTQGDGSVTAVFTKADGTALGQQPVTVTTNADLSQTYTFSNPYGTGVSSISVAAPFKYADVQSTAFVLPGTFNVYLKTNGNYLVDYTDAAGLHHYEVVPNGTDQVLYNQSGQQLTFAANKSLVLVKPYTDAQGRSGTDTYSISLTDRTGIQLKETLDANGKHFFTYAFTFVDAATGKVAYTATLAISNTSGTAMFVKADGPSLGQQPVTVVRNANTSQGYTFANPYGSGLAQVQVTSPVVYANVQATLEKVSNKFEVYQKTGTPSVYVVDYYDAFGQHHFEKALNGTIQNLYTSDGGDNVLQMTSGILLSETNGASMVRTLVSPSGLVTEQTTVGTSHSYKVHFLNTVTGLDKDVADIIDQGDGTAQVLFNNNAAVTGTWLEENTALVFTVNNTVGNGTVTLSFDGGGNITDAAFAHPFRARNGFMAAMASTWVAILQGGAFFAVGSLLPALALPAMVLGVFFGSYLVVGAVRYLEVAYAVRYAIASQLINEHSDLTIEEIYRRATNQAIAWSDGRVNQVAMIYLKRDSRWAANLVTYHETFKTELGGMLAMLPGVRMMRALGQRTLAVVAPMVKRLVAFRIAPVVMSFMLVFSLMASVVLTGCGKGEGPMGPVIEEPLPNTKYFQDGRVSVEMQADGRTWVVGFKDANGIWVTRTGEIGELYNQAGITVTITPEHKVQLVTPYQDAQGRTGTETYTVSPTEYTATDLKVTHDANGRNYSQYAFSFSNAATGQVAYTATVSLVNGVPVAQFVNADGSTLGQQTVTEIRHGDTSRDYVFSNPYGHGAAQLQVTTPVIYADVVATLGDLTGKLEVYQKSGTPATYIIDYYDAFGQHHYEKALTGSIQPLYISDGGDNVLQLTSGVSLSETNGATVVRTFVSPSGVMGEQTTVGTAHTYKVHIVDPVTGLDKDVATLVDQGGGTWVAQFANNPAVPVTWMEENTAAEFSFNNNAGNGTVIISFDLGGTMTDIGFVRSSIASLGRVGEGVTSAMGLAFFGTGSSAPASTGLWAVMGLIGAGYAVAAWLRFQTLRQDVRQALLESARIRAYLHGHPSMAPEGLIRAIALQQAPADYQAWVLRNPGYSRGIADVARSGNVLSQVLSDATAMSLLEQGHPKTADQVRWYASFKHELAGMLALLPGAQNMLTAIGRRLGARATNVASGVSTVAPASLLRLGELVGDLKRGESAFGQHPFGRLVYQYRALFGGANFNLRENVRFRVGVSYAVEFNEMHPGKTKATEALQAEQGAYVISVPASAARMLQATPQQGWLGSLLYNFRSWQAQRGLTRALEAYASETRALALEAQGDAEVTQAAYENEVQKISLEQLRGLGAQRLQEFNRPQNGRQIGLPAASLGKLLEFYRQSVNAQGATLWQAIEPQLQFLLKDGQVRSSAMLAQALLRTPLTGIANAQLRGTVAALQAGLRAAQAESQQNPERMNAEVNHVTELLVRSREGLHAEGLLLESAALPTAGVENEQVHLMIDAQTRTALLEGVRLLLATPALTPRVQENLAFFQRVLAQPTLTPQEGAHLQALLQAIALPEGVMQATVVGEDTSKLVGSLINGRVNQATVKYDGVAMQVAKPVVANIFANTEQAILNVAQSQQPILMTPFNGQLPERLAPVGDFMGQIGKALEGTVFKEHLSSESALAQAYYREQLRPSKAHNQQLVRVMIRALKYTARELEKGRGDRGEFERSLEAMNTLIQTSKLFQGTPIGTLNGKTVYTASSLSYGGTLGYVWLFEQLPGFQMSDALERTLRQQRLRNFRAETAA